MSTDHHPSGHTTGQMPHHNDVSFEQRDFQARTIYIYLAALAIAVIASFALVVYILRFTNKLAAQSDVPPPPVKLEMSATDRQKLAYPPEPMLQGVPGHETDAQQDLRDKIKSDTEANEKLGWIDQSAGIAQIPVKDAMKIIAEKGLPPAPAAASGAAAAAAAKK